MTLVTPRPEVHVVVHGATATLTTPTGEVETIDLAAAPDVRGVVVDRAAMIALALAEPVELRATGDRGEHRLLVSPDGTISRTAHPVTRRESREPEPWEPEGEPAPDAAPPADADPFLPPRPPAPIASVPLTGAESVQTTDPDPVPTTDPDPVPPLHPEPAAPAETTPSRRSFITQAGEAPPPRDGWRGALSRAGFPVPPSARERVRHDAVRAVSQHWPGCRTIAVVNGKGGVGKTMTTAMLAAVFGRYGGGSVLAWDNNDTRGTLGWRTETGPHDSTVQDLLPETARLLEPAAGIADIAGFVHHQSADRYDVLRSNPELLAARQRIEAEEFNRLLAVASRYYRMVIFDSGNDESADRWLRMVDSSYQLVIPTLAAPESAESAALLLEALAARDERSAWLAANAVVIVSQDDRHTAAETRHIIEGFEGRVRSVHLVPFDPALKSGALRFANLRPATRDAWLAAAASATVNL